MRRQTTKVLSVRMLPWPYFRTKKIAEHLHKTLSNMTMEALLIYFHEMQKAGAIKKKNLEIWIKEYHKEFPNEVD